MSQFIPLKVKSITSQTDQAICISFDLIAEQQEQFKFQPGQHLTIRRLTEAGEIRRCYSICSYAPKEDISIAVKKMDQGQFSNWANDYLKVGDVLDVMPPQGVFFQKAARSGGQSFLGVAAGSGITPILSIIKQVLFEQATSNFTLLYGNRSWKQTMFAEQIMDLKDQFKERFQLINIFSREFNDSELLNGRIDETKLKQLFDHDVLESNFDHVFACGPDEMMDTVESLLPIYGLTKDKIHTERFNTGHVRKRVVDADVNRKEEQVNIVLDGRELIVSVSQDDESILDAALRAGADLPYACKGGVCATCRCKVLSGEVDMFLNYSLEDDEVEKGYVLSCQTLPKGANVRLSFDE
ncbi:2Fe-2S iron-sulfur cluster-binding protein [Acinetobacter sp. NIPH 2100]|uniref:2Fe-2S iron-sulfur cluster-binding protein n=1 Tax=Acinetobacter sp. NIPH 2100 TaxID=1217708 RepID=UPI0002CD8152|nr:2Fe-2S iron-sulfur cluster-binding protein [Acinetobacter sp. NIPH 2100]ENX41275.1 phenylacetate-CoA oxygenase/reductase, PaaK subunit [Acinetobacter sp. NIPH 2100]